MYYELRNEFEVQSDAARTWEFFSRAENLPEITPPWLAFRILTEAPIAIGNDALLDYTIQWAGVPIRWRTRIIDWQPPRTFTDLQIKGPYVLWHHQHTFEPIDGGTLCRDRVIYKLPMGWLGRPVHGLFVRKQLLEIFRFRRQVIGERLGWKAAVLPDVEVRRL